MPVDITHDVFISYSSHDRAVASEVRAVLERAGLRCWAAPDDVPPGADYKVAIPDAVN